MKLKFLTYENNEKVEIKKFIVCLAIFNVITNCTLCNMYSLQKKTALSIFTR